MAHVITVSVTELPHFQRLVTFLTDAEHLAEERDDTELQHLIDTTRHDLLNPWDPR